MKDNNLGFYTDLAKKENLELVQKASSVHQNTLVVFKNAVEKSSTLHIPMINSSCLWGYSGTLVVTNHMDLFEVINIPSDINILYAIDNDVQYHKNLLYILSHSKKFGIVAKEENKHQYTRLFGNNIKINLYKSFEQFIQELSNE